MQHYLSAIGQDSHRFISKDDSRAGKRKLMLAGIEIPGCEALEGNSDADVLLHALTNAISGISGVNVLGAPADRLCREGKTDSQVYLRYALETLREEDRIIHVSLSVECLRPKLAPYIESMKSNIAGILGISADSVGLTATSGEGLTESGLGNGIAALCIITVRRKIHEHHP